MQKIVLFAVIFLLLSCGSAFNKLMYGGEIKQVEFYEEIDFDFSTGLPLIKVRIQGKEYTFLLDTGAPNILSKEVAQKIKYQTITSNKINDSQGKSARQVSVRIDTIQIGKLDFIDTGAVIIDFNKVYELSCFKFDGIIGANLMSKAIWEIDYAENKIAIADHIDSFDVSESAYKVPFYMSNAQRTPKVKIKTDRITFNKVTFDTGATGAFQLGMGKAKPIIDSLEGFEMEGSTSTGIFGRSTLSTSKYAKIDTTSLGNLKLFDQVIKFKSVGSTTLGNDFLKNYRVLIDWKRKEIKLEEQGGYDKKFHEGFDVLPRVEDNKLFVTGIVKESEAEKLGVQLNAQITSVNGEDASFISENLGCEYVLASPLSKIDTLKLTILQDGKTSNLILPRRIFISE